MCVVFCSAAFAQTAYFSGSQSVLPNSLGYTLQKYVAVDASGNVYVSDSSGAIYEMEAVNGVLPAAPVTRTLGSGFSNPQGVAVDAHGDVFVADLGNGSVKEIVAVDGVISALPSIRTLNTGAFPYGVAVDANGDVFFSDIVANKVYEMVAVDGVIPSSPAINQLSGNAFNIPTGLAVDASGNVYVADEVNNAVKEITAASGYVTVNTLGSGFLHPEGVVVDTYGNVYVADSGNFQVKEIVAVNGVIPATPTIKTLESGIYVPKGVALDASGDLFVAYVGAGDVYELQQTGGNFGQVNVGAASATITMTFTEITGGVLGTPAALTQGASGLDFAIASSVGTCSGANPGAGNTCTVNVTFTPQYPGERSGAVVLKDHLGAPIATGYLQGVGLAPQVSFLPATATTTGSGFATPGGLVIDAHGDIFVADTNNAAVVEIPAVGVQTPLASGYFSLPTGVAVDGDANVFVSDTTLGVVEVLSAGGYLIANPLGSGFSAPQGIAVDGFGNIYVADTGNDAVKELTAASGYTAVTTLGSGFSGPSGVAVDAFGDVFVADTGNNAVKEIVAVVGVIPALSPTIHTLAGSYNAPRGVALDGVGNVYVADTRNGSIKEITIASGYSTAVTLVTGITSPIGVTVSQLGNIYYTSASTTVAEEVYSSAPTLAFGSTNGLSATPEQTVTVQNIGNAKLNLQTPTSGEVNNPAISAVFVLDTTTLPTACLNPVLTTSSSPVALPAGESCTLSAYFDPTATGSYNGLLIVYDNALNVTTSDQIFPLFGTAFKSQTITLTPTTPVLFGTTQLLSASSTSGLPITFSLTGPGSLGATVCTLGTCTATLSYTGLGTVAVTATQAGNATYAAASLTQSIVVNQAAQTITFTPPASPLTYSATLGTILLSATASSGLTPVTFSLVSGPGSLSGANNATLTVAGPGTIVIAANQAGNANYSAAPQATQSIVVDLGTQTITFTAPASPLTYSAALGTIPLSATSTSGLAVSFSIVSGPGSLSGANNATLTVTGVGAIVIAANQAGNIYFAAASQATQSIVVNQGTQTITFSAPVSPITYTSGMATISLSATASSGLPVTFSLVSGPGSLSGANYATLTVTGVGAIVIAANQPGNTYFAAAPAVDQGIVVNAVPIAAAPTFALPAGTYALQQSVVILDSTPGATIYYTTNGTTPTPVNGTAIPSGTAITVSSSETVEAMAAAPGYTNSPVAAADYILSPSAPDFTVTASPTSVTVTAGQSVATAITVTPLNGFNLAVTLACTSGLPTGATCAITPATVTPAGGPVSAMVTITTTTATATLGTGSRPFFPAAALALSLCCFGIRKRRRILRRMVLLLVGIAGLGLVNGCAGSVGYTTAPVVSSLITVTATPASGAVHTTSFLLGVQP
jgi:sugar lactone lactonase YvrE